MANLLRRLFRRKQAPAPATGLLYLAGGVSRPSWPMATQVKEGYEANSVVYACVNKIIVQAQSIPWMLFRRLPNGDKEEVLTHPVLTLLERPSATVGRAGYMEDVWTYWLTVGNAFEYAVRPAGTPTELYSLPPTSIEVVVATENSVTPPPGTPLTYLRKVGSRTERYKAEDVFHHKLFHKEDDPLWGLSPLAVGAQLVDQDNFSVAWNRALLRNSARPDMLITTKQELEAAQSVALDALIRERFEGPSAAGRTLRISGAEVSVSKLSESPREMDWVQSTTLTMRRICQLYGVPPELVGDSTSKTYSNQQEARLALVEEVVFPLMERQRDAWNTWLVPMFDATGSLLLEFNKDAVDVVAAKRYVVYATLTGADWLTVNEQRAATGYETVEDPEADVPRVFLAQRSMMAALQEAPGQGDEDEEEDGEEGEQETEEEPTAEPEVPEGEAPEAEEPEAEEGKGARVKALTFRNVRSEEQKRAAWTQLDRKREIFKQYYAGLFARHFRDERRRMAKARTKEEVRGALNATKPELVKLYANLYGTVGRFFFEWVRSEFAGNGKGVTAFERTMRRMAERKDVAEALKEMRAVFAEWTEKRTAGIQDTTEGKIAQLLEDMLRAGKSDEEIAAAIEAKYDDEFVANRSVMIAETEVVGSGNFGGKQGAVSTGAEVVNVWHTMLDAKVRDSHEAVEGVRRPLNESFVVGSSKLDFPGDTQYGAPLEEIINCRCWLTYEDA